MKIGRVLLCSIALSIACTGAPISTNVWYEFVWDSPLGFATGGEEWIGPAGTPIAAPGSGPWTVSTERTVYLEIVDGFQPGDQFGAYNNALFVGLTSFVPDLPTSECNGGNDPMKCMLDDSYSRGVFALVPGLQSIEIQIIDSPSGEGSAWFRVFDPESDSEAIPEPTSGLLLVSALFAMLLLPGWLRRRRAGHEPRRSPI